MAAGTVAFDVMGTLFSLDRLRREIVELGAPPSALDLWVAQSLRDAFALSHAGGYAPLDTVMTAALPRTLLRFGVDPTDRQVARVMGALGELDLSDDSDVACRALHREGWRVVALTNAGEDITRALLVRAGIADVFSAVLSCDDVGVTKPHPSVYRRVLDGAQGDGAQGETWLVTSHAWDVLGASRVGLRTAWICRAEKRFLSVYPRPDLDAMEVSEAVDAILAGRVGVPG